MSFIHIRQLAVIAVGTAKNGVIVTNTGGHMKESEKWLALCDLSCQQKKSFPNCERSDIALEYRYYKQKEQAEEGK